MKNKLRHGQGGSIPTAVGSRRRTPSGLEHCRGHPRVRGEQGEFVVPQMSAPGSSPRAAGISRCPSKLRGSRRGHPPVRGEQSTSCLSAWTIGGSSPRARGAGQGRPAGAQDPGFIPRARGEKTLTTTQIPLDTGSFPQQRDGHGVHDRRAVDGSIPARSAGRSRKIGPAGAMSGSSPHAREKGQPRLKPHDPAWFIPADAETELLTSDTTCSRRHGPRRPQGTGQHDPPLHHLAKPPRGRPTPTRPRRQSERRLNLSRAS